MALVLSSSAFKDQEQIPRKYTGDGADLSPPLSWEGVPENAKGLVLICDDPDAPAGTWDHWILYDITPGATNLEEGIPSGEVVPGIGKQGRNDFGNLSYGGPAPPRGKPHRYFFRLFAVDAGTDKTSLRHKYPNRHRYIIAAAQIRIMAYNKQPKDPLYLTGTIRKLSIGSITAPFAVRKVLDPYMNRKAYQKRQKLKYQVTVAFGRRLEPWIKGLRIIQSN